MKTANSPLIYIVEDDLNYQEYIKNELFYNGHKRVELFTTGAECINALFKMPDIIVLDYFLDGEINGLDVLKKIKAFNPNIHVLLVSGQRKMDVAVKSLKFGAFDYIEKSEAGLQVIADKISRMNRINNLLKRKLRNRNRNALLIAIVFFSIVGVLLGLIVFA